MSDLLTDPKRRRWMRVRMVVLALAVGAGALLGLLGLSAAYGAFLAGDHVVVGGKQIGPTDA